MRKTANSEQLTVNSNERNTHHSSLITHHSVNPKQSRGFTLIEMMVSVSLFATVMMIGVGALLSLVETNRRAQAVNSVVNNLNAALESMARTIRVGTTYYCQTSTTPPSQGVIASPQDCSDGKLFAFEAPGGNPNDTGDQVVYRLGGTQLERSLDSGETWVALTAPEVSIDSFSFFVVGTGSGDALQPRVLMRIKGSAPVQGGSTEFNVQASVVQRILDI